MTAPTQTLAELSHAVAIKKGWRPYENYGWLKPAISYFADDYIYPELPDFTDPARLYELEGELQKAGWMLFFIPSDALAPDIWAVLHEGVAAEEPGTDEGRVRLILRAYLEAEL